MSKRSIIVYHSQYGCETGCCGHTVELQEDGQEVSSEFVFDHADVADRAYAEELVRAKYGDDHVKDLDWDNCRVCTYDGC